LLGGTEEKKTLPLGLYAIAYSRVVGRVAQQTEKKTLCKVFYVRSQKILYKTFYVRIYVNDAIAIFKNIFRGD
jgi:hypothetical protein